MSERWWCSQAVVECKSISRCDWCAFELQVICRYIRASMAWVAAHSLRHFQVINQGASSMRYLRREAACVGLELANELCSHDGWRCSWEFIFQLCCCGYCLLLHTVHCQRQYKSAIYFTLQTMRDFGLVSRSTCWFVGQTHALSSLYVAAKILCEIRDHTVCSIAYT